MGSISVPGTKITIFWFRRDLRIEDNHGLYQALLEQENILPLFIFDTEILKNLDNKYDTRVNFIYQSLIKLKNRFERTGSSLLIMAGSPLQVFEQLIKRFNILAVYANHDYEPYSISRDKNVKELLIKHNILFKTYKDQVIFEKDEVISNNKEAYRIFTPYAKKWRSLLYNVIDDNYRSEKLTGKLIKSISLDLPLLKEFGFEKTYYPYPDTWVDDDVIRHYGETRDYPYIQGTTRIGVHLRYGTISVRELVRKAFALSEIFLNELIWREYFMMILWNFPHVITDSFKPAFDTFEWINEPDKYEAWCSGNTGYPIIDAGMRELNDTGFMHNRIRMITASFLTRYLFIDWRFGEAYFASKLLDYELSSNNGNWQWAAGSGCDASSYYKIFNPETQTMKYDPAKKYISKWVPESGTDKYPAPVVDYSFARNRYLSYMKNKFPGNKQ
jgi:deoxyribodipyrimidine photo-lyase